MPSSSPLRRRQRRASGGMWAFRGIGHWAFGHGVSGIRHWVYQAVGFGLWALGFGDWVPGIGRIRGPVPVGQPRCCLPPGGCAQPGTLPWPGRQRPGLRHAWTRAAAAARMIRRALIRTPRHTCARARQPSRARGRARPWLRLEPGTWRAGVGNDTGRGRQAALRSTTSSSCGIDYSGVCGGLMSTAGQRARRSTAQALGGGRSTAQRERVALRLDARPHALAVAWRDR